jgi:hypothetical protein
MIDELDEALRELLIRDMPIASNEIDIAFHQPTREWASRLSRPTINIFMHDMRENNKLRTQQPYVNSTIGVDSAVITPHAVRLDVHYMITTWANDPGDEHRLMSRLLMVLYRHRNFPEELLMGELLDEEFEIMVKVAQYDQRDIRRDIWSMLDNEMRPILDLTMTISFRPYDDWTVPLVRETEIAFGTYAYNGGYGEAGMGGNRVDDNRIGGMQPGFTSLGMMGGRNAGMIGDQEMGEFSPQDRFYTVAGTVYGGDGPGGFGHLSIMVLEIAVPVTISPNGRYIIQNLREGVYTLEVWTGEDSPVQHTISVPSADYDIHL